MTLPARICLVLSLLQTIPAVAGDTNRKIGENLIATYPGIVISYADNEITFADGSTMQVDDGKTKDYYEKLQNADIEDMFSIPYKKGLKDFPAPGVNDDPGRIRCAAFFDKVYGGVKRDGTWSASAQLNANLSSVSATLDGKEVKLKFSKANGAAKALQEALAEIAKLPQEIRKFAAATEGTFVVRPISANDYDGKAPKKLTSCHAWGIAIDLRPQQEDSLYNKVFRYWKWEAGSAARRKDRSFLQVYPAEIVEIFEKQGFIWGGKWYHYDPMHFEFRPELLRDLQ